MECLVMLKGVPESGPCAELASETGTPRWVASSVSAHPLNAIASTRTDARVTCNRFTGLLETDGARPGWRAPKLAASSTLVNRAYKPIGSRSPTLAPTPNTFRVVPPSSFSESQATWTPTSPKLKLPPITQPEFVSWSSLPTGTTEHVWYRLPGEN